MGILGAKNKVIAGDYIGGKIMHSGGKVVLSVAFTHHYDIFRIENNVRISLFLDVLFGTHSPASLP